MEITQKSYLAKLLATEDLTLEHANVPTAAFDLKNRKIILPNWADMSTELYDMLIGHEVSHGLETPAEGWHDALCDKGAGFKSFLNVIEDARIERKIKARYPGLVRSFAKGYDELIKKDFFGLAGRDIGEFPLIDRINLHFKGGNMLAVPFSDEEKVFVNQVAMAETWEDVVAIAESLYEYSKTEDAMQNAMTPPDDLFDDEDDFDMDMPGQSSFMEPDEDAEETEDQTDGPGQSGEADSDDTEETDEDGDSTDGADSTDESGEDDSDDQAKSESGDINLGSDAEDFEPEAQTDTNFREREKELLDNSGRGVLNVTFPKLKSGAFVRKAADVWNFEPKYRQGYYGPEIPATEAEQKLFTEFNNRNKSAINQLVQQFEMRRKATALKKARENKTGLLNEDKLWAYKLTDDLFLSTTTVPDGKNHGMVMLVDMSGSMNSQMAPTLEQTLIQVAFCKKVGIPFKVFGFSNCAFRGSEQTYGDMLKAQNLTHGSIYIAEHSVGLIELISSELPAPMYTKAFKRILGMASAYNRRFRGYDDATPYLEELPSYLQLGMTPLAEAVIILRDVANEFKATNRIEVLNTIILTDGGNSTEMSVVDSVDELAETDYRRVQEMKFFGTKIDKVYIKEGPIATVFANSENNVNWRSWGLQYDNYALAMIRHYQRTTGSRIIGFRLVEPRKTYVKDTFFGASGQYDYAGFESAYKTWSTEKFVEVTKPISYDAMYLIKGGQDLNVDDSELEVKSTSKGDLKRGFLKYTKGRASSRVFLNRFIEKVA